MSDTRRAKDSGALRSPGVTRYPRRGPEVLVSAAGGYLAYGEALSQVIRVRHSEAVVRHVAPPEMAAHEVRFQLLLGIGVGNSGLASNTIELSLYPAGLLRFHVGGRSWSLRNPAMEQILAAVDEALLGRRREAGGG